MTIAIRLATLATVPVKRVSNAVNPVSKGDAWACAASGIMRVVNRKKPEREANIFGFFARATLEIVLTFAPPSDSASSANGANLKLSYAQRPMTFRPASIPTEYLLRTGRELRPNRTRTFARLP